MAEEVLSWPLQEMERYTSLNIPITRSQAKTYRLESTRVDDEAECKRITRTNFPAVHSIYLSAFGKVG